MAPNDLKWAKNDLWAKDSEFLPNSAIETQKTQKFGVNSEILTPLEPLAYMLGLCATQLKLPREEDLRAHLLEFNLMIDVTCRQYLNIFLFHYMLFVTVTEFKCGSREYVNSAYFSNRVN